MSDARGESTKQPGSFRSLCSARFPRKKNPPSSIPAKAPSFGYHRKGQGTAFREPRDGETWPSPAGGYFNVREGASVRRAEPVPSVSAQFPLNRTGREQFTVCPQGPFPRTRRGEARPGHLISPAPQNAAWAAPPQLLRVVFSPRHGFRRPPCPESMLLHRPICPPVRYPPDLSDTKGVIVLLRKLFKKIRVRPPQVNRGSVPPNFIRLKKTDGNAHRGRDIEGGAGVIFRPFGPFPCRSYVHPSRRHRHLLGPFRGCLEFPHGAAIPPPLPPCRVTPDRWVRTPPSPGVGLVLLPKSP